MTSFGNLGIGAKVSGYSRSPTILTQSKNWTKKRPRGYHIMRFGCRLSLSNKYQVLPFYRPWQ